MDFPITAITKPIVDKLVALQSFFFARPRIDIDLVNNPENLCGQKSLGVSPNQVQPEPISISEAVFDFEFYWNYKLRIKNNSSKTAYNVQIEEIYRTPIDHIDKIDEIASLKEGEIIELNYNLRHRASMNGHQANQFLSQFPRHLKQIDILVSYTNESRKKYYTRFVATNKLKINEHLLKRPKKVR